MNHITIDETDKRPPYEQICACVISLITEGELEAGTLLAPIRQLAGDLGVAPNTVARAYRELENAGFVVSRGRRGTMVCEMPITATDSRPARTIEAAIGDARSAGLSPAEIARLVGRLLAS